MPACPAGADRPLTGNETEMLRSVFGEAIDYAPVRVKRRRWFPFQPVHTLMAPTGHVHFHPRNPSYCDDFAKAPASLQGLFVHEMTHVWQTQQRGAWYLPLMRHPLCRYDYCLRPGWRLERYGIEQQAEIVRHVFLMDRGVHVPGASPRESYRGIIPFGPER